MKCKKQFSAHQPRNHEIAKTKTGRICPCIGKPVRPLFIRTTTWVDYFRSLSRCGAEVRCLAKAKHILMLRVFVPWWLNSRNGFGCETSVVNTPWRHFPQRTAILPSPGFRSSCPPSIEKMYNSCTQMDVARRPSLNLRAFRAAKPHIERLFACVAARIDGKYLCKLL